MRPSRELRTPPSLMCVLTTHGSRRRVAATGSSIIVSRFIVSRQIPSQPPGRRLAHVEQPEQFVRRELEVRLDGERDAAIAPASAPAREAPRPCRAAASRSDGASSCPTASGRPSTTGRRCAERGRLRERAPRFDLDDVLPRPGRQVARHVLGAAPLEVEPALGRECAASSPAPRRRGRPAARAARPEKATPSAPWATAHRSVSSGREPSGKRP